MRQRSLRIDSRVSVPDPDDYSHPESDVHADVGREQRSDPYKIEPHPPLVTQTCLRCGALVGSRAAHDAWHIEQEATR